MKDQRHNRLKVRARKFQVMEKYYSAWKHKVQIRAEEKVEETGKEVNASGVVNASSCKRPFAFRQIFRIIP